MATTLTEQNQPYIPSAWEQTKCLFCGSDHSSLLEIFGSQVTNYSYVRCQNCGLSYLNPRPRYDQEFVSTAYDVYESSLNHLWSKGAFTVEGQRLRDWYQKLLAEMQEVKKLQVTNLKVQSSVVTPSSKLLEIGCHLGFFCKVAHDQGFDALGVDISPTMTEIAKRELGLKVRCGNWLQMDDLGEDFDFVYCSHTIEHVPNPGEWLQRFRQVLAPNGLLCLEVPNMQSLDRIWKRTLKRLHLKKTNTWESWRTPDHLFEPCERSFVPFIEKQGFRILKVKTYSRRDFGQSAMGRFYNEQIRLGSNLRIYAEPRK